MREASVHDVSLKLYVHVCPLVLLVLPQSTRSSRLLESAWSLVITIVHFSSRLALPNDLLLLPLARRCILEDRGDYPSKEQSYSRPERMSTGREKKRRRKEKGVAYSDD
jgi:hypothetical protein